MTIQPAEAMLRWFDYEHLPADLQPISALFAVSAHTLLGFAHQGAVHHGPELTTALRKLLEAKDCAVRAAIAARDVDALQA